MRSERLTNLSMTEQNAYLETLYQVAMGKNELINEQLKAKAAYVYQAFRN